MGSDNGTLNPLLTLSIILAFGMAGGWAVRRLRLPMETGYLLAGLLLGPAALNIFGDNHPAAMLQPLSQFAMALLSMIAGSHLCYHSLQKKIVPILIIGLCESLGALLLTTIGCRWLGMDWWLALALGAIASATSPATTIALVHELRARGAFVQILLSIIAVDIFICLVAFAGATEAMRISQAAADTSGGPLIAWIIGGWKVVISLLLGFLFGVFSERAAHRLHIRPFGAVLMMLLFCIGISEWFGVNFLLTSLAYGIYLGNASEEAARQPKALEPLEPVLYTAFFVAAGASLHLNTLLESGILCGAFLVVRFLGKYLGAWLGSRIARIDRSTGHRIGIALLPQAGLAAGLALLLEGDPAVPAHSAELIGTLVLSAITLNEVVGPFFTLKALQETGEVNQDRKRLMDFLSDEFITTNLKGADKWEVIRQLAAFYAQTHFLSETAAKALLDTVVQREQEAPTALGLGVAVPHGRIHEGRQVTGVLGICPDGVDFGGYDGQPVKVILLVITPAGLEKEHLEVLSSLSSIMRSEAVRNRLMTALNPQDAWDIIRHEEERSYSYFLEA